MRCKEDFLVEFKDALEDDGKGVGLRSFYMKVKRYVSPRLLVTLLDDLNKKGEIVLTALCWPASGPAYRTVIKLPLAEWLVLASFETTKLYFFPEAERWNESKPSQDASAYNQFMLYVVEYGLPDDVQVRVESDVF